MKTCARRYSIARIKNRMLRRVVLALFVVAAFPAAAALIVASFVWEVIDGLWTGIKWGIKDNAQYVADFSSDFVECWRK